VGQGFSGLVGGVAGLWTVCRLFIWMVLLPCLGQVQGSLTAAQHCCQQRRVQLQGCLIWQGTCCCSSSVGLLLMLQVVA
jgi:hypothetical protein